MTQFASTLYPQTNPTSPILLAARRAEADGCLADFLGGFLSGGNTNHPQIEHARRVLTRLASFSG
ncbi:hypothetical protein [Microbacterium sp. NPDC087592]|uniref:hypothetical protein n=1 Tax=Microbacterium sp. NPDC087592 TaxID=3364193 RepID=UPI003811032E